MFSTMIDGEICNFELKDGNWSNLVPCGFEK